MTARFVPARHALPEEFPAVPVVAAAQTSAAKISGTRSRLPLVISTPFVCPAGLTTPVCSWQSLRIDGPSGLLKPCAQRAILVRGLGWGFADCGDLPDGALPRR